MCDGPFYESGLINNEEAGISITDGPTITIDTDDPGLSVGQSIYKINCHLNAPNIIPNPVSQLFTFDLTILFNCINPSFNNIAGFTFVHSLTDAWTDLYDIRSDYLIVNSNEVDCPINLSVSGYGWNSNYGLLSSAGILSINKNKLVDSYMTINVIATNDAGV